MKLLLYSHFFAPNIGGVETLVLSLAKGLAQLPSASGKAQFDVTLVTQTSASNFDDRALPFRVVRQPGNRQLWKLIQASDVVHVAGTAIMPMVLGKLARKPVVVEHHGFQSICPNGQLLMEPLETPCPGHFMAGHHGVCLRCNANQGWAASMKLWVLTFVRRLLCKHVAANISPTKWLGELIELPRVVTIPHGIEQPLVRVAPLPADEPPQIAFLGRLVSTKGVRVLLNAASILREEKKSFGLLIVGDGPERNALEELARDPRLNGLVRFTGRLSSEEATSTLSTASMVVIPSLGGEVFGLAVAENMFRGLPVVASDLGAFVEVLGGAGLTFETGNASSLAAQIARLLDEPLLRASLAQRGRERIREFCNARRMAEAHAGIYRGIQDQGRAANATSG
jgi:glycosyltransferase involved in cell wall biosynthesis